MIVKVLNTSEKQTVEIIVGTDGTVNKSILFTFEKDKLDETQISFDNEHWHSVIEAKVAIDAFIEKYPTFAMEE